MLRSSNYGPPIDLFACGAMMAEYYMRGPLFPGKNEID